MEDTKKYNGVIDHPLGRLPNKVEDALRPVVVLRNDDVRKICKYKDGFYYGYDHYEGAYGGSKETIWDPIPFCKFEDVIAVRGLTGFDF